MRWTSSLPALAAVAVLALSTHASHASHASDASDIASAEPAATELTVVGWGTLSLTHPPEWQCQVAGPEKGPTMTCGSAQPNEFKVLVTAFESPPGLAPTDAGLQTRVEFSAQKALNTAVQDIVRLQRVQGPWLAGYVYSLTDGAPERGPGDYREMTQGLLSSGKLVVSVTILTHSGDTTTSAAAVKMLATARGSRGHR